MEITNVYTPLSTDAFTVAGVERKALKDDFLNHFLASKVRGNKKKEVEENLNSYCPFTSSENRKVFKRKLFDTKSKKLTAKEKRTLKIYDIPKEQKFSDFFTLHILWEQYMLRLLELDTQQTTGVPNEKQWSKQLQSADFHGALVSVVKSTNASLIGKSGIVVVETRNTFKLATPKDVVSVVPKANCVFAFELKDYVFTIYGNNLRQRSAARSGKKFKSKGSNPLIIIDF